MQRRRLHSKRLLWDVRAPEGRHLQEPLGHSHPSSFHSIPRRPCCCGSCCSSFGCGRSHALNPARDGNQNGRWSNSGRRRIRLGPFGVGPVRCCVKRWVSHHICCLRGVGSPCTRLGFLSQANNQYLRRVPVLQYDIVSTRLLIEVLRPSGLLSNVGLVSMCLIVRRAESMINKLGASRSLTFLVVAMLLLGWYSPGI